MKKMMAIMATGLVLGAALAGGALAAEGASPVGTWQTIDDNSGKVRSLVRISEANGEISGKIEKIFPGPGEETNPKCIKCSDQRKDQPIIGMTFLNGLKKDGDEFGGGQILDPDNGKVYRSKIEVIEGGKKLKVRGYLGPFYRTQIWVRAAE
jgi:uncharacterized protein (DUF2147 family)